MTVHHLENKDVILSLCDLTGNFTEPWTNHNYHAVLVDPQHVFDTPGETTRLGKTIEEAMPDIQWLVHNANIRFVAGFPPCTDLAVSGARWFREKRDTDPLFQVKAGIVAEQCRMIGRLSGAPFLVENPVSVLSSLWGPPDHVFHPWEFTDLEPGDNYTKKTCLWTGNGFRMPDRQARFDLGVPDDRIHKAAPGEERANFRSATPMGFARAVFEANAVGRVEC